MWLVATILDSAGMDYACVISLEWAISLCLKIQPQLLYSFIQKKVSKKNTNSEMYKRQKLKAFQL